MPRKIATKLAPLSAPAKAPPLINMRDFFKNPVQTGHQLSPDGDYIAYLAPSNNRLAIWVRKLNEDKAELIAEDPKRDIRNFTWTTDQRIVYAQDTAGNENFKLFSVKRDGSGLINLTPWNGVRAEVVDVPFKDRQHIIIQHNKRDKRVFDAFRVNVETGEAELMAQNPGNVTGFVADHDGVIRIEMVSDGVNAKMFYRASSVQPFKQVLETNFREQVEPQVFTADNQRLIAVSNIGRDKKALVELDPATAKELKVIYENPEVDVDSAIWSEARQKLVAAVYTTDKQHYVFFNKLYGDLQHDLEAKLPGLEVALAGTDQKEQHWVVKTWGDRTRGDYYIYDGKVLTHLTNPAPWIHPEQMAAMIPVSFTSRDGVMIHGYLTLPLGMEAKNLPVVLHPHGGPWLRDTWGFNPEAQFLANRGYAVLQVNYRGSTGYGRKFWELGFGQWGRAMQDDLTDGVQEMIRRGVADPKRIGIYGGSYGGYATLAGVAFTPDLYAAAVDYCGIANLQTFLKTIPPYWEPELKMMQEMIGNAPGALAAQSPINSVNKVKTPLLIAQGLHDPRVNKNESDQMVTALKARGIDVPYMVKDDEGHGFHNEENRFNLYRAIEQFFGKYLRRPRRPRRGCLRQPQELTA